MTGVLLDTHAWVWSLVDDPSLSPTARRAIEAADTVSVSPISLFEIGQKVRIGKWPEMAPHVRSLPERLLEQGGIAAPMTPKICLAASLLDWLHRDPFDRLIAATALATGDLLISADPAFDTAPEGLHRAW